MSDEKIVVELVLDDGNFTGSVKRAGRTLNTFDTNAQRLDKTIRGLRRSHSAFLTSLRDLAIVGTVAHHMIMNLRAAIIDWQTHIITANAELERMQKLLQGMSKSTTAEGQIADAASDMQWLISTAQKAPFAIKELGNTFVKFRSVGLDPTTGSMNALVDAVANFGGSDQILHRASVAIQQMAGKGIISMEELRQQLGEAVPNAIPLMARALRMSVQDMVKLISEGRIQAKPALARMFREFELSMGGSAERMMETWNGLVSQLTTQWQLFLKDIGDAGYFDEMKNGLREIVEYFKRGDAKRWADIFGQAMRDLVVTLKDLAYWVKENWRWFEALGKTLVMIAGLKIAGGVFASIVGSLSGLAKGASIAKKELSLISLSIATAPTAFARFKDIVGIVGTSLRALGGPIMFVVGILATLAFAFTGTADKAQEAVDRISQSVHGLQREQIATLQTHVSTLEAEIATKQAAIAALEVRSKTASGRNRRGVLNDIKRQQAELKILVDTADELRVKIPKAMASTQLQEEQNATIDIQNQWTEAIKGTRDEYNDLMRSQQDVYGLAYNQERVEIEDMIAQGTLEKKVKLATDLYDTVKAQYDAVGDLTSQQGVMLAAKLREAGSILENAKNEYRASVADSGVLEPTVTGDPAKDPIIRLMNNLEAEAAGVEAQLEGTLKTVAKFKSLAKPIEGSEDFMYKGSLLTKEQYDQAIEYLTVIEKGKAAYKGAGEAADRYTAILNSIRKAESKAVESVRQLSFEYETGIDPAGTGLGRLKAWKYELEEMAKAGELSAEHLQGALARINEVIPQMVQEDALKKAVELREANKELAYSLMSSREAAIARWNDEETELRQLLLLYSEVPQAVEAINLALELGRKEAERAAAGQWGALADEWDDATGKMIDMTANWASDFANAVAEMTAGAEVDFSDMIDSMIADLVRFMMQAYVMQPIYDMLGGLIGGGSTGGSSGFTSSAFSGLTPITPRANGGIATGPSLNYIAEAGMNEAYVPLPDGKSIPVSMNGGMGNVQVNVINESGVPVSAEQKGQRFDGEKMVLDVVLNAMNKPGSFRTGMKGAMK